MSSSTEFTQTESFDISALIEEYDIDPLNSSHRNINQASHHYAKNAYIGEIVPEEKEDHIYRIYAGNPNGLKLNARGGDLDEYLQRIKDYSVDTLCLYEINLDTTKYTINKNIRDTCDHKFTHQKVCFSSSSIPAENDFKPGGTFILSNGSASGRITESGQDYMGRWAYQTMACKNHRWLTVISAYQPCDQHIIKENGKITSMTVTAQQTSILRSQGSSLSPRQAFIQDLRSFLEQQRQKGHGILLLGDFNEPLDEDYNGMTKLCAEMNLTDLMYQFIGTDEFPTWFRTDNPRRIDYVLCDEWIALTAEAACYEPFSWRNKGDHRSMVIDFDATSLFGNPNYRLDTPAQREFSAKDRTANRTYIEAKYQYLSDHSFETGLSAAETTWDPSLAETLDTEFQRAGNHAVKKCKKKPNVAYVKKLAQLRSKKNVLLRLISQHRTGRDLSSAIAFQVRHGNDFTIPETLEEIQQECRSTQKAIRDMEKQSESYRRNELKDKQQELKEAGDKKGSRELRNMIIAENTKRMYKKLRFFRGFQKTGLTRLEVPQDPQNRQYKQCDDWVTVEIPAEIEAKLLDRNQFHFGQANGTFPTTPPFSEWVDWGASTHISDLILEGEYSSELLDEMQQSLINHMKKRCDLNSVPEIITEEEWINKIKVWPESTSTSPSGFHLTHSKALVSTHSLDVNTEVGQEFEHKRTKLISWQVRLLNLALRQGYSYNRWKTVVNVMILKEPNNVKIHRLRVIHLYEHDYNLILACKWRQIISQAACHKWLNEGQYGAVPGRDAVIPTIIEELQYEISRASKRPLLHMDYDATACYDRIVMSLGSLISRGYGLHRQITLVNARTLQECKYLLKTQLGVSKIFYQHCEFQPIYGSGQGAGNSPALWCVISSVLFDLYEEKAHGATFQSPDQSITVKIFMIGFVDDTSGSINDFALSAPLPPSHYTNLATHDAQRWNDVLRLSGGALEDTKCSYHFLYYDFTVSGLATLRGGKFDPVISIKFNHGTTPTPLRHLPAHSPHKTLGVMKSPSDTSIHAFQQILIKNTTHAKTIAKSPFSRIEVWSYYHAIYLPSLLYPFPSCTIPDKKCDRLQRQVKKVLLPKYGFNRNMPNAIVYGTAEYGGLELRTISVEQGIAQLYNFLICLRSEGTLKNLALIAVSWGQFLAGISTPIFEDVSSHLPHLEPMKWLPAIRHFLARIECKIEIEKTFVTPLQRENDFFLMDVAIAGTYTDHELKILNACRLYLGVQLFSDIVMADGLQIYSEAVHGLKLTSSSHKGHVAYQDRPHAPAWVLWRRFLRQFTMEHNLLVTPLGRWYQSSSSTSRQWQAYFDEHTSLVYILKQGEYEILQNYEYNFYEFTNYKSANPPMSAVPIDLDLASDNITIGGFTRRLPQLSLSVPTSFSAYVDTLAKWEQELLLNVKFDTNVYDFVSVLGGDGTISMTSDGSAPQFIGSFGWACSTPLGRRFATNNGPAYGYRTSSYRAEGYGLLSFLRLVIRTCEYAGADLPTNLELYTDSESLVKELAKHVHYSSYYPNATMKSDWDVLQAIRHALLLFPTLPTLIHVYGHQDDQAAYASLPLPAQLNVDADHLAGSYVYHTTDSSVVPRIDGTGAQLHSATGTITSNFRRIIRKIAAAPAMKKYLCTRNRWSEKQFDLVDWNLHGSCVRQHYNRKHFMTKYIHDWLPVGKMIQHYDKKYAPKCPSCEHELEDRNHFLRCKARPDWQKEMFTALRMYFAETPTRTALMDILIEGMKSWLSDRPVIHSGYPDEYNFLIHHQGLIGWDQIFFGRFVHEWSDLQEAFLKDYDGRKKSHTGLTWVKGAVRIIWRFVYRNWEARNSEKHGMDKESIEAKLIEMGQAETQQLYDIRTQVLPRDRALFYATVEEHYERENTSIGLRQWIRTWKPAILRSIKDCVTLGLTQVRAITEFTRQSRLDNT